MSRSPTRRRGTWTWLIDRGVPGGLSAEEMADDLGITSDVAALRLAGITALGLAHEVSPGRYRRARRTSDMELPGIDPAA